MMILDFYKNKKVLVTGHTGFKGSWLCSALLMAGASVTGYALEPPTEPSLFKLLRLEGRMDSRIGDIRDLEHMLMMFEEIQPEIVIHMAAQPIVLESYRNPVYTYDVNVMGTVNILECVRRTDSVKSFVNVTTDKVYKNREWAWGYRECEELNGYDPYSNSKSCSELVTEAYRQSFFSNNTCAISTMRAGNVIGGGDFAVDRIVPDCFRAASKGESIQVRNPNSIRPYQHVLEPVMAYLLLAGEQMIRPQAAGAYNIGPDEGGCICTGELVDLFCNIWNADSLKKVCRQNVVQNGPHEAGFLRLDNSKFKQTFAWHPVWNLEQALEKTVEIYRLICEEADILGAIENQIVDYLDERD